MNELHVSREAVAKFWDHWSHERGWLFLRDSAVGDKDSILVVLVLELAHKLQENKLSPDMGKTGLFKITRFLTES